MVVILQYFIYNSIKVIGNAAFLETFFIDSSFILLVHINFIQQLVLPPVNFRFYLLL